MSNSTKPRIQRNEPLRTFYRTTVREALEYLMRDFDERCAYSMQHVSRACGKLEVDHFNPRRKKDAIQKYSNLFPATRNCNRAKSDQWPSNKKRKLGFRFLNCTEEPDYGLHIFEDPDTHELVGVTTEGRYHIRACDLNIPHLIQERKERFEIWQQIKRKAFKLKGNYAMPVEYALLKNQAEKMIPIIEFLSGAALEHHRKRKLALAAFKLV
jgi:hypothetical protein